MLEPKQSKFLARFIVISRAEALSFLVLLLIAMPLKYTVGMLMPVKIVGWIHGLLFMAYMAQLFLVAYQLKWDVLKVIYGFIAGLLPFGPFVFERSISER